MTLRRTTVILLAAYALLTFYPALSIFTGVAPSRLMTPLTTLVGFTFALLHAGQREGWLRALRLLALVFAISLLFESVGVATGLVYGPYHYTLKLGPLFLGLVPYLIPVAWFMMSYPSFVIADRFVPTTWGRWPRLLAVAAMRRNGNDRLGPGHGSHHGGRRSLGVGCGRRLSRHSAAELSRLVADRLHHIRPLPASIYQTSRGSRG